MPRRCSSCIRLAAALDSSAVMVMNAFNDGLYFSILFRQASVSSSGDTIYFAATPTPFSASSPSHPALVRATASGPIPRPGQHSEQESFCDQGGMASSSILSGYIVAAIRLPGSRPRITGWARSRKGCGRCNRRQPSIVAAVADRERVVSDRARLGEAERHELQHNGETQAHPPPSELPDQTSGVWGPTSRFPISSAAFL